MRLVAGYVRVSRVAGREGDSFQSPDAQEDAIRAHCRAHRLSLVEVVRELDESGGKMERPKLQRLIGEVEAGKLAGIVVWRIDRFARTLVGGLKTLDVIHRAGGFVQTVEGSIDTSAAGGAMGELQLNLLLTLAQWERAVRAEGFEASKQRAVERGVHIGPAPVGYLREKGKPLTLDPAKHNAISQAFELRSSGAPYGEVARLLDELLPGGPSGRGRWNRNTVTRLLVNRAYLGEARGGAGKVKAAAHPAIVSRETFDTVHALASRRDRPAPGGSGAKSLLAGVVRCGSCGYALDRNRVGGGYLVYRCRGGVCEQPTSAMADRLEGLVSDAVLARLGAREVEQVAVTVDVGALHDRLAAARVKREPFEDPDYVSALGVAAAMRALRRVDDELEAVEQELADAVGTPDASAPSTTEPVAEVWPTLTTDERRAVIFSMIDTVAVSRGARKGLPLGERVAIYWQGDDVPLARRSRGRRRHRPELEAGAPSN